MKPQGLTILAAAILLAVSSRPLLAGNVPAKRTLSHPNVILITIDTLRADHLGCYGYKEIRTPTIDALAHDGVVFSRAISQVPLTWPSHVVMLTGTYPFQNGVQDFTGHPLSPEFRSIAQAYKQAGYATGAVVSSFVLDRSWGLARGFDYYDDAFSAKTFEQKEIGLVDRKAQQSVSHALSWLKRTPRRPFFLWLHLYDPHSPYDPPEPFRGEYREHPYDGEIAYADHELGRLISYLKQTGMYGRSLIMLLSDHGESLGEHGEAEHGFFIYNSTLHIPLIVKLPAGSRISRSPVDRPVETIAIAPTLLGLAGVRDRIEDQLQGKSLFAAAGDENDAAYSETFYPFSSFGWSPLHSLETSRYHYIEAPQPELYDLSTDPAEKKNLASEHKEVVAVMKEQLKQRLQEHRVPTPNSVGNLSPDAAEKLRALGYVAYRSPVSSEALAKGLPDPKDKLPEFNSILQAQDAFRAGRFESGKELLEKVAASDPQMYVVPFLLGEASLRQQNWGEAAAQMKRCLELNPNFDEAMTGLSHALHAQGDDAEAEGWLNKAVQSNPQNYRAWYEMGLIQAQAGDRKAAIEAYEKAVSIQGNFPPLRRDLGLLYYQENNYSAAAGHLAKAIALGMGSPSVYNNLGISYSQIGQLRKATKCYREALKLDPNLAQAHLNLAYAYQQQHRAKEARVEYQAACKLQDKFCAFIPKHR